MAYLVLRCMHFSEFFLNFSVYIYIVLQFVFNFQNGFYYSIVFILVLITTYAVAQNYPYSGNIFNGCDYYETIELGRVYDVFSPYYPEKYPPGTNCRWSGCAPYGTNLLIRCTDMAIPVVIIIMIYSFFHTYSFTIEWVVVVVFGFVFVYHT